MAVMGGLQRGPVRLWMIYIARIYPTSLTPEQYADRSITSKSDRGELPQMPAGAVWKGWLLPRYITTAHGR